MPSGPDGTTIASMRTTAGAVQEGTLMSSADAMRASDEDREKVVRALQEQVGAGRLTLAEFDERSTAAYAATTIGDLRKLTADLPIDVFGPPAPRGDRWPGSQRPMPMPGPPRWPQRGPRGDRFPVRRASPMLIVAGVFFVLVVVNAVFAAVGVGLHLLFPVLPLLFVMLVIFRRGPGRYRR
jgi:hypothetical protein